MFKKILSLTLLLFFVVKIEQFGKKFYWHAYKITDNKILCEYFQRGEESITENLAKFDWLKTAEFFGLQSKDWSLYESPPTYIEKKIKDKKTYDQIAEESAKKTDELLKKEEKELIDTQTIDGFMNIYKKKEEGKSK